MRPAMASLLSPRSVAIVGFSSRAGGAGHNTLGLLTDNAYDGAIHLVGREPGSFEGRAILSGVEALPEGIDLAVLTVPATGVLPTLEACVKRRVRAAIVFASGFAELGDEGRLQQARIGEIARAGGLTLVGPNCLGYMNYVDRIGIGFATRRPVEKLPVGTRDGVAIVTQSGAMGGHLIQSLGAKNVPVSYMVSTGNEVDAGLGELLAHLVDDPATRVLTIYAEHIRRPSVFLDAVARAEHAGKAVAMLHSGRGAKAQAAAQSHTGAMAGDYAIMKTCVEAAGVVLVETLDELLDASEILSRFPKRSPGGLGVMTCSGAFCSIAHDLADDLGIDVPALSASTVAGLAPQLPPYMPPHNPLDLGTQTLQQPELMEIGADALLRDANVGALAVSIPSGPPKHAIAYVEGIAKAAKRQDKPVAVAMLGDGAPLPPECHAIAKAEKLVLLRSSDRVMRAMAHVLRRSHRMAPRALPHETALPDLPTLGQGTLPEWLGKKVLAAHGLRVPQGELARSADEAVAIAAQISRPVAMKAQAARLAHKTEAGGVLLGRSGAEQVRSGWHTLVDNVQRAAPGTVLDGVLVEAMAPKGVELLLGARRDAQWGPVLLVGLGGIWVEAMQDMALLPVTVDRAGVLAALGKLKAAKLLAGFRGMLPADADAVADAALVLARLIRAREDIMEIEINPLMVHASGEGVTALDALIVTRESAGHG